MLAANEPIGRFIVLANIEKDVLSKSSIEQDIENLIDLIKIRISNKSIENVSESLLNQVFDLRFEVLEWLANENKSVSNYFEKVNEIIADNLQLGNYSDLADTISEVLLTYEKIAAPIANMIEGDTFEELLKNIQESKPNYEMLNLISLHPSPQVKYLKNWIDSSLHLEIGLILSDLILTQQVKFPKKRIKAELIKFLLDTITRYGAYSIFTGFWEPEEDDVSVLVNKMKILSGTIELDNNIHYKTSKDGLFSLINN